MKGIIDSLSIQFKLLIAALLFFFGIVLLGFHGSGSGFRRIPQVENVSNTDTSSVSTITAISIDIIEISTN